MRSISVTITLSKQLLFIRLEEEGANDMKYMTETEDGKYLMARKVSIKISRKGRTGANARSP